MEQGREVIAGAQDLRVPGAEIPYLNLQDRPVLLLGLVILAKLLQDVGKGMAGAQRVGMILTKHLPTRIEYLAELGLRSREIAALLEQARQIVTNTQRLTVPGAETSYLNL